MERLHILQTLESTGVIAVIRVNKADMLNYIVDALLQGGVKALEITMTTPNAIEIIQQISQAVGDVFLIGAGTVLDAQTAQAVIFAGAQFVVSPVFKPEVVEMAHRYDRPVFPGAFTPTEILQAWENGADVVKVFPAGRLGPQYFKDIHGPLPQIKLTPTGGVNLQNTADFIRAGASFVGVGTALLDREMIQNKNWRALSEHTAKFVQAVQKARKQVQGA